MNVEQEIVDQCKDIIDTFGAVHGDKGRDLFAVVINLSGVCDMIYSLLPGNEAAHNTAVAMTGTVLASYCEVAGVKPELAHEALSHYQLIRNTTSKVNQ